MKKADWLITLAILAMGAMCLAVSAASFQTASSFRLLRFIRLVCFGIPLLAGGLVLLYAGFRMRRRR